MLSLCLSPQRLLSKFLAKKLFLFLFLSLKSHQNLFPRLSWSKKTCYFFYSSIWVLLTKFLFFIINLEKCWVIFAHSLLFRGGIQSWDKLSFNPSLPASEKSNCGTISRFGKSRASSSSERQIKFFSPVSKCHLHRLGERETGWCWFR